MWRFQSDLTLLILEILAVVFSRSIVFYHSWETCQTFFCWLWELKLTTVIIICTLHNVISFITMNTQITNSEFSNNGKFGETNESFPRKSLVSFAEKTESIDLSTQLNGWRNHPFSTTVRVIWTPIHVREHPSKIQPF